MSSSLPASLLNSRRHVGVHAERVSDVSSTEYPGHYPDEDYTWDLEKFKEVGNAATRYKGTYMELIK